MLINDPPPAPPRLKIADQSQKLNDWGVTSSKVYSSSPPEPHNTHPGNVVTHGKIAGIGSGRPGGGEAAPDNMPSGSFNTVIRLTVIE